MIERYAVTAGRIRQELASIAQAVERAERAIERLIQRLRPSFEQVQAELLAFADFLDRLAQTE